MKVRVCSCLLGVSGSLTRSHNVALFRSLFFVCDERGATRDAQNSSGAHIPLIPELGPKGCLIQENETISFNQISVQNL
jgi:hypothetical protein